MKLLTLLIYTLLITCIIACGKPQGKRKDKCCKQGIEHRMENDTTLVDSVKQVQLKTN